MKLRAFFIPFLLIATITSTSYYATARQDSKTVFSLERAMNDTQSSSEVIQLLVKQIREKLEKDIDNFPDQLVLMDKFISEQKDPATIALLHSLTAEMYQTYYNQNRWNIQQRTDLKDFVPEDIREWTPNLFEEKIQKELNLSLSPVKVLQETKTDSFAKILDLGKDARALHPTLYDFLLQRAISIQPKEQYYQQWISFKRQTNNPKALTLVSLNYLRFQNRMNLKNHNEYKNSLDSLYQSVDDNESRLEINLVRLNRMKEDEYLVPTEKRDSIKSLIYNFCQDNIKNYASLERCNEFKNTIARMEHSSIYVRNNQNVYPGKNLKLNVSFKNIKEVTVCIFENKSAAVSALRRNRKNHSNRGKVIKKVNIKLPVSVPYITKDTVIQIPMEEKGLFEYEVVSTSNHDLSVSAPFSVSKLALTHRKNAKGIQEVFVTDFESGQPLVNVPVICYDVTSQWIAKNLATVKTDKNGLALLNTMNRKQIDAVRPVLGNDTAAFITGVSRYYRERIENSKQTYVSLFTDRGIYRPGQTVLFKGIVYSDENKELTVKEGNKISITLRDANYKEVAKKEFTTNEFGSIHGEFVLPQNTLNGYFSLQTEKASTSFRVEEYKRPSYRLEIEPIREEVSFNQTITIKGKAETFSGVRLQEGKVKWTITLHPFWLRSYMPNPYNYSNKLVAEGYGKVNDEGLFEISFKPEKEKTDSKRQICQSYEVKATLTDSKGESQETSYLFSVGETNLLLSLDLPQKMNKEEAKATVIAQTINREKVPTEGSYSIYNLTEIKNKRGESTFHKKELVTSGSFASEKPITEGFQQLESGRYRMEVKAKDNKGIQVKTEQDFIIYTMNDVRPPVYSSIWMPKTEMKALPGETVHVIFGTSENPAFVLYEIFNEKGGKIDQKIIKMKNENRSFPIVYQENFGDGFTASFSFVKNGKLFTNMCSILKKEPDRKLIFQTETFRDRIVPGNQESWKFRLTNADSLNIHSEILAGMYDMSLDQIMPFNWNFNPQRYSSLWTVYFRTGQAFHDNSETDNKEVELLNVPQYQFDQMYQDWKKCLNPYIGFSSRHRQYAAGNNIVLRSNAVKSIVETTDIVDDSAILEESIVETENAQVEQDKTSSSEFKPTTPVFRENFTETAFFYPILRTDDKGNVSFHFTVPESNTTWKLQMLAHTKDLKYGYLMKEIVTSKPIMVAPNLPRFLRQGDEAVIATQIINQLPDHVKGSVSLELFNPENNQIYLNNEKPFEADGNKTETIQWNFNVEEWNHQGVLGCRILVKTDKGTDGEQHLLPLLSNQILITESIPFYLNDETEKTIRLPREALQHPYRLTFEMSGNPIWYAIQALSTLNTPKQEDMLSWFSVYYSNTLSKMILNSSPKVKEIIRQWQTSGKNTETLLSNLEKNKELKNVLLEETPWVLEAENESEQKQRLQLLFDMNRSEQIHQEALQQLLKNQLPNGGWSWMKGMPASNYITLQIMKGMAQLTQLEAIEYNSQEKEMQMKALKFLDMNIQEDYERTLKLNKNMKSVLPSDNQIEYLFVRSFYRDVPELGSAREAIRFYTAQAERYWKKYNLYSRAAIGWLMWKNGKSEIANDILKYFQKTATTHPEKGMYWANNRGSYYSNNHAIETHCLIMDLFNLINPDQQQSDKMKQWLLNQKRTQNWESVPATQNAIYALLVSGSKWIEQPNNCTIQWGKLNWETSDGEYGTDYIKVSPTHEQISQNQTSIVNIRKEGKTPAWGAIYTQYFAPINQVQKQKGVLNVEKKLFVETTESGSRQIRPVTTEQPLKVGDKVIVRLTIRSDRAMDYVFLKDLRAACLEVDEQLSGSQYRDGIWYYKSSKDISENIYIEHLPEGTFVLEYPVYVSRSGKYSGGICTIQCLYAPEFISRTEGTTIIVDK